MLARRMNPVVCRHDPFPRFTPGAEAMPGQGSRIGDVLATRLLPRIPRSWALPPGSTARSLYRTSNPNGPRTERQHTARFLANGNLYCRAPAKPAGTRPPRPRRGQGPGADTTRKTAEAARYTLCRLASDDGDGYCRSSCPAVTRQGPAARCGPAS